MNVPDKEDQTQNVFEDYLEHAKISYNVFTLRQLQQRHQELLARSTEY